MKKKTFRSNDHRFSDFLTLNCGSKNFIIDCYIDGSGARFIIPKSIFRKVLIEDSAKEAMR